MYPAATARRLIDVASRPSASPNSRCMAMAGRSAADMRRPRSQKTDAAPSNVWCWSIAAASVPTPPTTAPARTIGANRSWRRRRPRASPAPAQRATMNGRTSSTGSGSSPRATTAPATARATATGATSRQYAGRSGANAGGAATAGRGGWQGGLDDRRHHHLSAHHGPLRGQGCCHRRPGGASTPRTSECRSPSECRSADAAHHTLGWRQTLGCARGFIRRGGSGGRGRCGGRGARRGRG